MRSWTLLGVAGFDIDSRSLVRDIAELVSANAGAPVVTLTQNGPAPRGPFELVKPFFPAWAEVPLGEFALDNWISLDIVAAAPELRSAPIPSSYQAVESERGLWWVYRNDPAEATREEIAALWHAVYPGLMRGGEARRAVRQKLKPARRGAGIAELVEVNSVAVLVDLVVSVDPMSKTPLKEFARAVCEWGDELDFYDMRETPAERKAEVRFSFDLGNSSAPNPANGPVEFARLLELLQAVGSGNEVIRAAIL